MCFNSIDVYGNHVNGCDFEIQYVDVFDVDGEKMVVIWIDIMWMMLV